MAADQQAIGVQRNIAQHQRAANAAPSTPRPAHSKPPPAPPVVPVPALPPNTRDTQYTFARPPSVYQQVAIHPARNTYEFMTCTSCRVCGNQLAPFEGLRECTAHLKWEVLRPREHQCAQPGCDNHSIKPKGYRGTMVCAEHIGHLSPSMARDLRIYVSMAIDRELYQPDKPGYYPPVEIQFTRARDGGY